MGRGRAMGCLGARIGRLTRIEVLAERGDTVPMIRWSGWVGLCAVERGFGEEFGLWVFCKSV